MRAVEHKVGVLLVVVLDALPRVVHADDGAGHVPVRREEVPAGLPVPPGGRQTLGPVRPERNMPVGVDTATQALRISAYNARFRARAGKKVSERMSSCDLTRDARCVPRRSHLQGAKTRGAGLHARYSQRHIWTLPFDCVDHMSA